jgi:hypothetical protein
MINRAHKILIFLIICFSSYGCIFSQVKQTDYNLFQAKEFSKEIALYNSKKFLFKNVLGSSPEIIQFEVIPLAAASSGELTTLLYKSEGENKEGLILGFYGNYYNDNGVSFQGYAFKNLNRDQATAFLAKIEKAIIDNKSFLRDNNDNNNISFQFEDMEVLIWTSMGSYTIRVFWQQFDSTWEETAYERSKRRFERKIK